MDKSLTKFNVAEPLVINTDNTVIGGNFRLARLRELGVEEVDVRVPSRTLTRKEAEELNLRLNKNQGEWDLDLLANFNEELLEEVGFRESEIDRIFLNLDEFYQQKIMGLVYEPHLNVEVKVDELFDESKVREIQEEIEKANIRDEKLKKFLLLASYRHCVFRFDLIAEYYAQLKDAKIKELFKKNALVIIDYQDAIKNGWAELYDDLIKILKEDER